MSRRVKNVLTWILKAGIFLLIAHYIIKVLKSNSNLKEFQQLILSVPISTVYITMVAVFVMMVLNWHLESLKWKYLCTRFHRIGLGKALMSVYCGLSWAVFTPNRIGEYGGRVMFLPAKKRVIGVVTMAVGAFSQLVITNVAGALSIIWFAGRHVKIGIWLLICILSVAYALAFLLVYFNMSALHSWLVKIKFLARFKRFFDFLLMYDQKDLAYVFFFSLARYLVFTAQYCLLMQVFIPDLPFGPMLLTIPLLFFIQSALPSLDLFDVGVRSITAGFLFGFLTEQDVAVMAVAACVWFVNLIVPAIIGSVFVFRINFFAKRGH